MESVPDSDGGQRCGAFSPVSAFVRTMPASFNTDRPMKFRINYGICLIAGLIAMLCLVPLAAKFDLEHHTKPHMAAFRKLPAGTIYAPDDTPMR